MTHAEAGRFVQRKHGEALAAIGQMERTMPNEYAKHEPGPALDRLVAERVMGWVEAVADYPTLHSRNPCWCNPTVPVPTGRPLGLPDLPGQVVHGVSQWDPSTDIACAWEVVERLCTDRWLPFIQRRYGGDWSVSLRRDAENDPRCFEADGDTMPLAVCRAALATVAD